MFFPDVSRAGVDGYVPTKHAGLGAANLAVAWHIFSVTTKLFITSKLAVTNKDSCLHKDNEHRHKT